MRKLSPALAILAVALAGAVFAAPRQQRWPTIDQQLKASRVQPGTALEELILSNQDFQMLRAEEAHDSIQVPLWLRVWWRKAHPEGDYPAADPTGGYPRALREVAEWMTLHQDLVPDQADDARAPGDEKTTVGPNVRISPQSGGGPDIRLDFWDTSKILAADNNIGGSGQQSQYYSSSGGASWGQSFLPLQTGDAFHSNPAVDWTSDGTAWSTTLGINSTGTTLKLRAYKSTNGGATWTFDNTASGAQTNTDMEMIWADHSATSPFKDYLYACWHNGNPAYVNRRTGPTGSWGTPIKVSGTETTGTSIGCDVKTNSAGDAFVFWPDTGSRRIVMAKSTDGGTSWGTRVVVAATKDSFDIGIPSNNSRRALIYTSAAAYRTSTLSNVYVTWTDLTGDTGCTSAANEPGSNAASTCKTRIWLARSTDGGTTWSAPVMINNQASLNDQFNPWLGVDETTGRLAVIYYDSVGDPTRQTTNVWYQTSTDNGVTWSTATRINTVTNAFGTHYGDHNGLSIDAGKAFPIWIGGGGTQVGLWTVRVTEP
ncbi:MAG TPA: sialidase family protein [Thermoanaerobaculia bacterium]